MGGGPSKEELEHREYMERKRLERQKEENEHKERMKGNVNFRMPAKSQLILRHPLAIFDNEFLKYTT